MEGGEFGEGDAEAISLRNFLSKNCVSTRHYINFTKSYLVALQSSPKKHMEPHHSKAMFHPKNCKTQQPKEESYSLKQTRPSS